MIDFKAFDALFKPLVPPEVLQAASVVGMFGYASPDLMRKITPVLFIEESPTVSAVLQSLKRQDMLLNACPSIKGKAL